MNLKLSCFIAVLDANIEKPTPEIMSQSLYNCHTISVLWELKYFYLFILFQEKRKKMDNLSGSFQADHCLYNNRTSYVSLA